MKKYESKKTFVSKIMNLKIVINLNYSYSFKLCKFVAKCVNNNNNNNLDLARELKKLWNMKVTVIPIVIDALGTITKGFVHRLEDLEIRG